jgi:hypothetical protein
MIERYTHTRTDDPFKDKGEIVLRKLYDARLFVEGIDILYVIFEDRNLDLVATIQGMVVQWQSESDGQDLISLVKPLVNEEIKLKVKRDVEILTGAQVTFNPPLEAAL